MWRKKTHAAKVDAEAGFEARLAHREVRAVLDTQCEGLEDLSKVWSAEQRARAKEGKRATCQLELFFKILCPLVVLSDAARQHTIPSRQMRGSLVDGDVLNRVRIHPLSEVDLHRQWSERGLKG